ncbi:hypothetical protein [Actinoplanes sp. NPDC049802]|uniref:hypothetical protein n=1 Tax=Actinoplanes sp. NPDC049802 TaxID=3154742 RepID=UPI0033C1334E
MSLYWDPATVLTPADRTGWYGRWPDLHWANVPGPVWTGETDNCWTGRLHAPANILYGGEYLTEFVYRQPRTPAEVRAVVTAAGEDPFGGYGFDGDERWTPETVRGWWRDRGRVTTHVAELIRLWEASECPYDREAAGGAREFRAYLAGPLAQDLRIYLFWLLERRSPLPGEPLPGL